MAEKRKRSRCPKCGGQDTIRWSVRNGHQRYKCKSCSTCFTPRREDVSISNRSAWFRKWVLGKQTIEDIASASGYSERQLRRWFAECLEKSPPRVIPHRRSVHLLADGIWFGEGRCLIVYRDADSRSTVHYRFATEENENEVIRDLKLFKDLGIRRAYTHIRRALPNMFKYIDDPAIPSNTNGLESFFGHLRDNLRIHRGLSVGHHDNFIRWYLFFVDEKKRRTL